MSMPVENGWKHFQERLNQQRDLKMAIQSNDIISVLVSALEEPLSHEVASYFMNSNFKVILINQII